MFRECLSRTRIYQKKAIDKLQEAIALFVFIDCAIALFVFIDCAIGFQHKHCQSVGAFAQL